MAPTYAHMTHRVTMIGDCFGGQEEWNTGFYLGNPSADLASDPTLAEATAIAAAWQTFFTAANSGISNDYRTIGVKVARVNTNGQVDGALTQFYNYPTAITGNNSGANFPPQISLVATLATIVARGHGSKGRMYLPGVMHSVDASGRIETANAVNVINGLKTFIDAVNAHADVPERVVLNSAEVSGIPFRAAKIGNIISLKVGNVYDTQRRRRAQLQESYSTATLA